MHAHCPCAKTDVSTAKPFVCLDKTIATCQNTKQKKGRGETACNRWCAYPRALKQAKIRAGTQGRILIPTYAKTHAVAHLTLKASS
jgi:hypothetical protein